MVWVVALQMFLHHGMGLAFWASCIRKAAFKIVIITYSYIARTSQQQTLAFDESRAALYAGNQLSWTCLNESDSCLHFIST